MAKRSDIEVGETHLCNHRNSGGISPVELRRGGFTIQLEWIFLKWLTKYTGYAFAGVDKIFQEIFLPCLFFVKSKSLPPIVGILITMLVKKYGLGLQYPVT